MFEGKKNFTLRLEMSHDKQVLIFRLKYLPFWSYTVSKFRRVTAKETIIILAPKETPCCKKQDCFVPFVNESGTCLFGEKSSYCSKLGISYLSVWFFF